MIRFCIIHTPQLGSAKIRRILKGWGFSEVDSPQTARLLIVHQDTDGLEESKIDQFIKDDRIYVEYTGGNREWKALKANAYRGSESQVMRRLGIVQEPATFEAIAHALSLTDDDLCLDKVTAISVLCQGYLTARSLQDGVDSIPVCAQMCIGFEVDSQVSELMAEKYRGASEQVERTVSSPDWWLNPLIEGDSDFEPEKFIDRLSINWAKLGGSSAGWESVNLLLADILDAKREQRPIESKTLVSDALVSIDQFLSGR